MTKPGKPLNLILLGDPAAGKATQAALLIKKYQLYDLDMGKELRKLKRTDRQINYRLQGSYDQGKLTQTNIVRALLHHKIMTVSSRRGILFDGTPKMLGEAQLVAKWLKQEQRSEPLVIYLSIP